MAITNLKSSFNPVPKPEKKTKNPKKKEVNEEVRKRNNANRNFGKAIERNVADLTGGERVPMSGAVKNSVWNLEGDVRVRYPDSSRVLSLIECKGTSGITPSGDKTFTLKKSVLDQAKKEGELVKAIPAVWLHWKNANYEQDDYVIIPAETYIKILDELKYLFVLTEKEDN